MNPIKLICTSLLPLLIHQGLKAQDYGADFLNGDIRIALYADRPVVAGEVTDSFRPEKLADSIYLDSRELKIDRVQIDGKPVHFQAQMN